MILCRICLSSDVKWKIGDLKTEHEESNHDDIFWFCFGIQISQDSEVTQQLCPKCYDKTLAYYDFKKLALKNNAYLCSLHECSVNLSDQFKLEEVNCDEKVKNVKVELEAKEEDGSSGDDYDDDVFLSVLKTIKREQIYDIKSEGSVQADKRRKGCIKKKKTKTNSLSKTREVCDECGKSVYSLKEHASVHMPRGIRRLFNCNLCDKQFTSRNGRGRHFRVKHLGIKQHCNVCNKDVVNLKMHTMVVHNPESLQHKCTMCDRRFINQSTLDSHMTIHTHEKQHECSQCDSKFRNKNLLLMHIRAVHEKEKTHLCQYCSKSFFKKYHLQMHLRMHTNEKPCKCPECGKCFKTTTILRNHRTTHNTERLFVCTLCDMSFTSQRYLRKHMLIHTKIKPYACKYCDVKFGRSDHRARHQYTAHEQHLLTSKAPESTKLPL